MEPLKSKTVIFDNNFVKAAGSRSWWAVTKCWRSKYPEFAYHTDPKKAITEHH